MIRRALLALTCLGALAASAGGALGQSPDRPHVVATTPVLGAIVGEMVGDAARVTVVMPNGADPHEFQPSAREVAELSGADLVVANGLGLEEGLEDALRQARDDGTPVVEATDLVRLRKSCGPAACK